MNALARFVLLAALALILGGCGFHLRNSADLPFATLYIDLPESSDLRSLMARNFAASGQTKLVKTPGEAEAILSISEDRQDRNILSLSSTGRVREYQLVRTVGFRLHDGKGGDLIPSSQIVLRRDITYNDDLLLAKGAEENLLWRDMLQDAARQILRRMAVAQKPLPPAGK